MVSSPTIEEVILTHHRIRKTPFRLQLLSLFFKNTSLSPDEISRIISLSPDKATVYRALESFEKKGIIHRVPDANNTFRYALCKADCQENDHRHNHVHFICKDCKLTFCITEAEIPKVSLPKGYVIQTSQLTSTGYCPSCYEKNR